MGNAKIQYTVRIEEIPKEANKHLVNVADNLEKLSERIRKLSSTNQEEMGLNSAKELENVRQEMGLLDLNLEDCYSMLVGYANYQASKLQKTKSPVQAKEQVTDESTGGN